MEKRLFLALALSLLVVIGWSSMMAKLHPVVKQDVTANTPLLTPDLNKPVPVADKKMEAEGGTTQDSSFENVALDGQEIIFALPSATIKDVIFKNYGNHSFTLQNGFWLKDPGLKFRVERLGQDPTFIYQDGNKEIIKHFIFDNSNNSIVLEIITKNLSDAPLDINYPIVLGTVELSSNQLESRFQEVALSQADKMLRLNLRRNFASEKDVKFMALKDRYFCLIAQPGITGFQSFINKLNDKKVEVGLLYHGNIQPGQELNLNFSIYLGPQKLSRIEAINPEWGAIINYGTFDYISKLLLKLLGFLYSKVHNWGVAIVLLSFAIYFILFPLTLKQMHSMKRMQELQPKIEKIRQIYKDNSQKLNMEIMELYKKEKANPFSGCLPMLLQIPIFFALYQSLIRSVDLKGADFLWIKDLSEPDRLIMLSNSLPVIGKEINILPVLMAIMMFFQQKSSSMPGTGSSQEQQRLMMIIFPILFGFIFYHMPSGLVLYWFINTSLMSIYQFKIKFQKTAS